MLTGHTGRHTEEGKWWTAFSIFILQLRLLDPILKQKQNKHMTSTKRCATATPITLLWE